MNLSLKLEPTKYKVLVPPWEIIFCLNAFRLQPAEPARGFRAVPPCDEIHAWPPSSPDGRKEEVGRQILFHYIGIVPFRPRNFLQGPHKS